ncbi:methyl-accepting chemotaxis protein [Alteromonas pelagimontana]|uniref:methyl-accepting chemotaxis protein n=1 Tax=Alteromonas pelagimontana TaxID=1858656 RepID=UPI000A97AC99|nr:PAS domain-containing methyl-accepting chemotaxis protein [Alteromonas pelagimontana]
MFNSQLKLQLRSAEEKVASYDQIFDSLKSEMLHLTLDNEGIISEVNELFESESGFKKHHIVGSAFVDLVPKRAQTSEHFRQLAAAIKSKHHWAGAVEVGKYEKLVWLRVILQPIFDLQGKCQSFDVFGNNLTRTIEASKQNENLISALHRSMAVIEFFPSGEIITANSLFLQTVGYSLNEVQGRHHQIFCTEEERRSDEYAQFWHRLNQGQYIASRFKRVNKKGQTVWLEATYNPIFDSYGKLYKIVKFATDISQQVRRENLVNEAAVLAADTSISTGECAEKGLKLMQDTALVMEKLSDHMAVASQKIKALEEQSSTISKMVSAIGSIADQTNLLALNAAIEAARAGDQGRGFAVVADEVRQLASRTSKSTEEIMNVFSNNERLTKDSVITITQSMTTAEEVVEHIRSTHEVIDNIQAGAEKMSKQYPSYRVVWTKKKPDLDVRLVSG